MEGNKGREKLKIKKKEKIQLRTKAFRLQFLLIPHLVRLY